MAANFTLDQQCEGKECQSITDVTYYVEEKKRLCDDCASKQGCIARVKRGGPNIYCEEHDEKVKLYCKSHGVSLCYSCAMIKHRHPCKRHDINDAIMESRARLTVLIEKARDNLKESRQSEDEIDQCTKNTDAHLQALKDEVKSITMEAINRNKVKEKTEADKINQKFDDHNQVLQEEIMKINEKIRKNDEEREKQLELIHTNAQIRQGHMDNKKIGLHRDIDNIVKEKDRKIRELMKSLQDDRKTIENAIQTIDTVLEDDKNIVKDGHSVNISVSDKLKKPLY
ncbi:nuclear factor 7, ovary-like [Lytechinus variegatus]|uniref:nuclear factor 7, ovary-like n=1 Tax=Lytechinus variegatus TaxID=7654 RepID=UPI001BB14715|nr:nuclear factor 7, ovary-like [Lytechinus variegatus]